MCREWDQMKKLLLKLLAVSALFTYAYYARRSRRSALAGAPAPVERSTV
jgi:hypothetical protein